MDLKKGLIITGAVGVLIGVGLWAKYQAELSYKLVYGTRNAKLKKITPSEVIAEFELTIDNPTELSVGINGLDIDVYANGVKVSNILSEVPVALSPNKMTAIPLKLSLNPKTLVQNTGTLLQTGLNIDNVVLTMRGFLRIRKFGIPVKVPFVYTATYKELMG